MAKVAGKWWLAQDSGTVIFLAAANPNSHSSSFWDDDDGGDGADNGILIKLERLQSLVNLDFRLFKSFIQTCMRF
jgi:hypothetical protein